MQNQQIRNRKIAAFVLMLIFVGLLIAGSILYVVDKQKTASLKILIAPSKAVVERNNKEYKSNGTFRLRPGSYTAKIIADGFISQEVTLDLKKDQTESLYIILNPTAENEDWYNQHQTDSNIANIISDYYANLSLQDYRDKYPIVNILPILVVEVDKTTYDWTEYRIDYGKFDKCRSDFCLKITDSTGGNYDKAVNKIKEAGYNPEEYQILYEYTPVEAI